MGKSREIDIEKSKVVENQKGIQRENSYSSLSPLQNIPLLLPQEADGLDPSAQHTHRYPVNPPNGISGSVFFSSMNPKVEALEPDTQMMDDLYSMDLESGTNINSVVQSGLTTTNELSESSEETDHAVATDDGGQTGPRAACKCQVSNAFLI